MQQTEKPGASGRYLESSGGPLLALIGLLTFIGYLAYVHHQENITTQTSVTLVDTLQKHSSAAQAVSIAAVLLAALIHWGTQKVLFKIRERERLIERIIELETRDREREQLAHRITELEARDAEKTARIAEQTSRIAEQTSRIAELENQQAQQKENEPQ